MPPKQGKPSREYRKTATLPDGFSMFSLVTGIYADVFNVIAFKVFRKGNKRMYICPIRTDVVADDELL